MREHWLNIAENWDAFNALKKDDKNHPMHILVIKTIRDELQEIASDHQNLIHGSSVGQSAITMTPWFASMDTRITESAQDGYYIVYLIDSDLQKIYLSFGLGATQFDTKLKGLLSKQERIASKKKVCNQIRELMLHKIPPDIQERMLVGKLPLGATKADKAHIKYENASAFAISYDLNALPDEETLVDDYLSFLDLYQSIVTDPIMPSIDDLIVSTYIGKIEEVEITVEVEPFSIRSIKKSKRKGKGNYFGGKDSKQAKRTGDIAEKLVLEHEKEKLINGGRPDLADKVIHEEAEKNRPGWDITSYESDGTKIYIEVKGSSTDKIDSVVITRNEWNAAQNPKFKDNYYLYLVRNALTKKPTIEKLLNPVKWVNDEEFQIEPSQYSLKLYK